MSSPCYRPMARALIALLGALLAVCGLPASAQSPSGNLVYNGDFENADGQDPPAGWQMWGADQYKVRANYTTDASVVHAGSGALRIVHPAGSAGYVVTDSKHAIPVQPGRMYTVSLWARSDAPAVAQLGVAGYGPGPDDGYRQITTLPMRVDSQWRPFSLTLYEGWDFFSDAARYLRLALWGSRDPAPAVTLWVDDVSVTAAASPRKARLIDMDHVSYAPVPNRLSPGESLSFTVDANRVAGPAARQAGGLSFHRVSGFTGQPFDSAGAYSLDADTESAIRDLKLPMTRFYGVAVERYGAHAALDKISMLVRKLGIPEENTVIELETQSAARDLSPAAWVDAIEYCRSKGYRFRYWEITNEPYSVPSMFRTSDAYAAHFLEVAAAIRKAAPDAQIGLEINPNYAAWSTRLLALAAGQYDFVAPHYYYHLKGGIDSASFEDIVLGANYAILDVAARINALIKAYNPGRDVYQYDTEWALYSKAKDGREADWEPRNANIIGTLHRAVRLIYYAREGLLRGASAWNIFASASAPGFAALSPETPGQRYLLYWLYYYFNRHVGASVLDIEGDAPYYSPPSGSPNALRAGPLTPVLATMSADKSAIYLVMVNGSWDHPISCRTSILHFPIGPTEAVVLSQSSADASPLLKSKSDAVAALPIQTDGGNVACELPPHSVVFVTLRKANR